MRTGFADGAGRVFVDRALPVAGLFLLIATSAASNGAFFPRTWGWVALPLAWVAILALLFRPRVTASRLELAYLAGLAAYACWVALSLTWSEDFPQTVLEVERDLIYPLGIGAGILVLRRRNVGEALAAVVAAIVVVALYAFGTRVFPDRIGTYRSNDPIYDYRLGDPVGYWNALGIFCTIGLLLALGFAARARRLLGRTIAGASIPLLLTTIYFTFGRGVWIALGIALVATVALDPRRLQLLAALAALAPPVVASVWLASRSDGLTARATPLDAAAHDGHRFVVWFLLLTLLAAASALAFGMAERRLTVPQRTRRLATIGLAVAVAVAAVAIFVAYGSPPTLVRKAYRSFNAKPVVVKQGQSFNKRLFTFSSNGRVAQWHVAWRNYRRHALLGSGAGSFEQEWLQHRSYGLTVSDAHSLYVEALTELGPLGLLLLVSTLLIPLAGGLRARAAPLVPFAWGAYLAFVVHAGVDWDWEVVAVTFTGLFVGLLTLAHGREGRTRRPLSTPVRSSLIGLLVAVTAFSIVGLLGNVPLSRATAAFDEPRFGVALTNAEKAVRWMPWAGEPRQALGRAERGLDEGKNARRDFLRALERSPRDWSMWYDLATVSRGRAATCAYVEAARLNPLDPNIAFLREKGLLPRTRRGDAALRCVPRVAKPG